jgi:hypothetical protein
VFHLDIERNIPNFIRAFYIPNFTRCHGTGTGSNLYPQKMCLSSPLLSPIPRIDPRAFSTPTNSITGKVKLNLFVDLRCFTLWYFCFAVFCLLQVHESSWWSRKPNEHSDSMVRPLIVKDKCPRVGYFIFPITAQGTLKIICLNFYLHFHSKEKMS